MIPETPVWYKLATNEINRRRDAANIAKSEIDRQCQEDVDRVSDFIWEKRSLCKHNGPILYKESLSGRPHDPDIYICSLCTTSLNMPAISAEIVRVSQEELQKFYCK